MKKSMIVAALTASLGANAPLLSHAGAKPVGFDSCVTAFVASLATAEGAAPKLRESRFIDRTMYGEAPYEMTMIATNPRNNREVARASCTVNSLGEVIAMVPTKSKSL